MKITRGKIQRAQKVIIYGPEGIGKSTLAAAFPNPLFIDTEGGTAHMDVARLPAPASWEMLLDLVRYARDTPGACGTLVIDTADWAERLCAEVVCAKSQKTGIEDFGYGKGYIYLAEEFGRLLNLLDELIARGVNAVLTAHALMRKFEQPDELGAYDRWEMKLQKKTGPMIKEWADMVLFANYKTYVINVDNQGAGKGKNKAQGGERVLYTTHHPCWDAKNRHGLPDELPMTYAAIAAAVAPAAVPPANSDAAVAGNASSVHETATPAQTTPTGAAVPPANSDARLEGTAASVHVPEPPAQTTAAGGPHAAGGERVAPNDGDRTAAALRQLMAAHGVTDEEIQMVVAERGYYTRDTPIEIYDPAFVSGVLVAAWGQVYDKIQEYRTTPF